MHPRQIRETFSPVLPKLTYSMIPPRPKCKLCPTAAPAATKKKTLRQAKLRQHVHRETSGAECSQYTCQHARKVSSNRGNCRGADLFACLGRLSQSPSRGKSCIA